MSVTLKAHMQRSVPPRQEASQGPTAQAGLVQHLEQPAVREPQQMHNNLLQLPPGADQPQALDPPAEEASATVKQVDDTANLYSANTVLEFIAHAERSGKSLLHSGTKATTALSCTSM